MKNVKLPVEKLLASIKANRAEHREIFLEAQKGYRKLIIKELDERLKDAKAGRKFERFISAMPPSDHTKDYDRVIAMLEMCTETEVELSEQEFGQYVMDQWAWRQQFLASNSAYSVKAAGYLAAEGGDE
jgi:hypothetical protein